MRRFLLISLFLVLQYAYAQEPVHSNINNQTGLPSNTVYHLMQDQQGFIWIGHDKGLSRYDGKQFKHFPSPSQQGRSLSNLHGFGATIWCQDFAGNLYYTQGDSLKKETTIANNSYYMATAILGQQIVVAAKDSLHLINGYNHTTSHYALPFSFLSVLGSSKNEVLLFTQTGLYSFNGRTTTLKQKPANTILYFIKEINGKVYGFTKNSYPYIFLLENNQTIPLPLLKPGLFIQDIAIVDDEIWICTSTGAYCFYKDWRPKYNGYCFFEGSSISNIIKDREGSYWFATLDKGITIVPNLDVRLYGFNNESITSLAASNNHIIAGTANHRLLQFNTETNGFNSVFKEISNQEILSILSDDDNNQILFCSDRIGYVQNGKKVKEITNYAAKSIAIINSDFYAVAFSGGVSLIRRSNTKTAIPSWLNVSKDLATPFQYRLLDITTRGRFVLFDVRDSTLYAATTNGLFYFSPKGKGKVTCNGKDVYASQLAIAENGIYVATFTEGLYKIGNNHVAEKIVVKGICNNIYKLKASGNDIWIIGDGLLQQFNILSKKLTNYTHADGLPKAELKDIFLQDGKVYLATTEGLAIFDKRLTTENKVPPTLVINAFKVNEHTMPIVTNMEFANNENSIGVLFSLLSFRNADNTALVQYKINDGDWINMEPSARELNLPSLSPSNYTISLRAFNEDGVQSKEDAVLQFTILAPLYKRWWFIVLISFVLVIVLFLLFGYRERNIKQKNALLAQKMKAEQDLQKSMLASIKSQMNPHFLFNALNTIQSYIYTNDKENASAYLGKFSELTRLILDMSNKETVSLSEEVKALQLYLQLEQQRFEDKLQYSFIVDDNISAETVYIPSMLIQPYIENAIKHGLLHKRGQWVLSINISQEQQHILVTIDDNGIGRKRSAEINSSRKKHQSFALDANQKRLEILNWGVAKQIALNIVDKQDADGNALGTTIVLSIPVQSRSNATYS